MRNLIRANFVRMLHDKVLWIMTAILVALGMIVLYGQYRTTQETNFSASLDSILLGVFLMVGVALAIFAPLFVGTEYSDGTMRNKLLVGAKRTHLYIANFSTCAIAGILMDIVWMIVVTIVGFFLLGPVTTPVLTLLLWIAIGILLTLSLAAIFTLITMLVTNKAVSAIICLSLSIVLLMVGYNLFILLHEPEFYDGMVSDVANTTDTEDEAQTQYSMQYVQNIPNPKYIPPEQRPFVQAVLDILPTGQAQQLTNREVPQPWLLLLYSAVTIAVANGLGIFAFRRKDLK